jgi:hypothetical protein
MHRIRPANERAAYLIVTNERQLKASPWKAYKLPLGFVVEEQNIQNKTSQWEGTYLVVTNERQLKASPWKVYKLPLRFVVEEHYTQNKTGHE